jgi:hypothetical protein
MNQLEQNLYERICGFELDNLEAQWNFSAKTAWEYQWSELYTLRVMQEYKKFAFLAVVADHCISPPPAIDRVWHQHLLYTQSYWHDFCGEILKKPLHHAPSLGGQTEYNKYLNLYELTLKTYQQYFGNPPDDIWPPPHLRGKSSTYQWVNSEQYWIVPNPNHFILLVNKKIMALLSIALENIAHVFIVYLCLMAGL